jgi:hypothetical protein
VLCRRPPTPEDHDVVGQRLEGDGSAMRVICVVPKALALSSYDHAEDRLDLQPLSVHLVGDSPPHLRPLVPCRRPRLGTPDPRQDDRSTTPVVP